MKLAQANKFFDLLHRYHCAVHDFCIADSTVSVAYYKEGLPHKQKLHVKTSLIREEEWDRVEALVVEYVVTVGFE